jgi:hypothetical protein
MHNKDNSHKKMICRVCGYFYGDYIWGEDGRTPSFEICPCCGTEFGYHDATLDAIKKNRKQWVEKGAPWFDEKKKPSQWSLEEQLKNIPEECL